MKLTPKQEKFCQNVVSGMSYKDAYIAAYDTNSEKAAYIESSKLALREDIQDKITALQKPVEQAIQKQILTERERKKAILWHGIEIAQADNDHAAVARYMDILNKMDMEYANINVNTNHESIPEIKNLDTDVLKSLIEKP